ncbi:hypothetical protein PMIN06_004924 [Paraphaeosphaeria minitans]
MWYLETHFSAKVKDHSYAGSLGLQVADVEAAVAAFKTATWREKTDHQGNWVQMGHPAHAGSKRKMAEILEQEHDVACRNWKGVDNDAEEESGLHVETTNSRYNGSEMRNTESRRYSHPTSHNITKKIAPYSQEADAPTRFAVLSPSSLGQAILSLPELSQHSSSEMEQEPGHRDTVAEAKEQPEYTDYMTNSKSIQDESAAAYRRVGAGKTGQEEEIVCKGAGRKSVQDDHLHTMKAEAVTLQHPSPELARVKSARMEVEAAYGRNDEERKKFIEKKAFEKLVVDVQAARRPQTAPPPSPQAVPDAPHQPPPRLPITAQQRYPPTSPRPSPLTQSASHHPPTNQHSKRVQHPPLTTQNHPPAPSQLAYAQYMAVRQHAHSRLSSQTHTFASKPLNVRQAGPYSPISPQPYAQSTSPRKSPPPPVRTSQYHIPPTQMSPREHQNTASPHSPRHAFVNQNALYAQHYAHSPGTSRHPSLHLYHRPPYPPPYTQAPPQNSRYPRTTPHQQQQPQQQQQQYDVPPVPPTPRHQDLHDAGLPPRESAETMLRKLELQEAEAKLRASIMQEQLRAEVVAKKMAVARALMMEERGLR